MDFLDPNKKRKHQIRLLIGYGLLAVVLAVTTVILFYIADGYGSNPSSGVFQNGILFVDAHPEPAQIYLNDEKRDSTDARYVLPEGNYKVRLERDGYKDWNRTVNLRGGTIEKLVYSFMIPEELERKDEILYGSVPPLVTQSPDRHWIISQSTQKNLQFEVADLSSDPVHTETFSLDPLLFSHPGPSYKFTFVEWSDDNRHVILKHTFGDQSEYLRVDRERPQESSLLTDTIRTSVAKLSLKDKRPDAFYVLSASSQLLRIDSENALPVIVAENVIDFKPHGSRELLYIVPGKEAGFVDVFAVDGNDIRLLRSLPKSTAGYVLDLARYDNNWVVAVGSKEEQQVYVYRGDFFKDLKNDNVADRPKPTHILRGNSVLTGGQFSTNARFFAVQSGKRFSVYDAELTRQYVFTIAVEVGQDSKSYWMDGHRLNIVSADDKLYMFDFDGLNSQELATNVKTKKSYFDRDYDRLFTITSSRMVDGRFALQKTYLRTEADR